MQPRRCRLHHAARRPRATPTSVRAATPSRCAPRTPPGNTGPATSTDVHRRHGRPGHDDRQRPQRGPRPARRPASASPQRGRRHVPVQPRRRRLAGLLLAAGYSGLTQGATRSTSGRPTRRATPARPRRRTWSVDTVAPPLPSPPGGPGRHDHHVDHSFAFSGEAGGTFDCNLDGGAWGRAGPRRHQRPDRRRAHLLGARQGRGGQPGARPRADVRGGHPPRPRRRR